jgi:very-short-patch-repair endonuclease
VYAVGNSGGGIECDLAAAVLYAGPDARLAEATALWWRGLLKYPSRQIQVSTPRRVRDIENIVVRRERTPERVWHRGLPMSTPSQAIAEYAATATQDMLRFVLANADYHGVLDAKALQDLAGRGVPGSPALRDALKDHLPALAHTRSRGERLLLSFCRRHGFPVPMPNVYIGGWLVDAVWREHRIVIEIDGDLGHRTPAQLHRDHQRDLELRALGYIVLRYTERQLIETPEEVAADIRRHLQAAS